MTYVKFFRREYGCSKHAYYAAIRTMLPPIMTMSLFIHKKIRNIRPANEQVCHGRRVNLEYLF